MTGILIVTHGKFGQALKESSELIVGEIKNCETISLDRDDDVLDLKVKVNQKLDELNSNGDGVIVLVDLIGGSPFNMCSLLLKERKDFKLLAGVNLSMLIECSMMRETLTLSELLKHCKDTAIQSIAEVTT